MATTRGWGLKGNISDAINYILDLAHDEKKTEQGIYTYTNAGASPLQSVYYFDMVNNEEIERANIGYHFQLSLKPGEGTPEDCLEMAKEWINTISNGKAKYVIAVHLDKESIHAHIVTDSILEDGKYWNIYWKSAKKRFRAASDRICKKYGYSILEETQEHGRHYFEWMQDQNKNDPNRVLLKKVLDEAINKVASYQDLKSYMQTLGFKIYDNQKTEEEKNIFRFTANIKLIHERPEGGYLIRVPYQKDLIQVDEENFKWLTEGKTAEIKLPIDKIVNHYNKDQIYIGKIGIDEVKRSFDDKTKKGRQGLSVLIPGASRTIRTQYLDEDGNYSLNKIIERIQNNGRYETDPEIQSLLNHPNNYEKVQQMRRDLFQAADVKFDLHQSTLYRSIRQENYFKWKANQFQRKIDKYNYSNLLEKDRKNIDTLRRRKDELQNELRDVYDDIRKVDVQIKEMMLDQIESIVSADEKDIDRFISENRVPLETRKKELKEMITLYDDRIKKVTKETQEKEKSKKQERDIYRSR